MRESNMEASRKFYCEGNMSKENIIVNGNEAHEMERNFCNSQIFGDNFH